MEKALSEKEIDKIVVLEADDESRWEKPVTVIPNKSQSSARDADQSSSNATVSLDDLIDKFQVDTGIEDLAAQHDHYLYGTPKK